MLDERLSLNEAADLLGRSSRQLRRDVQAGRLHAQGGGRGKALWFKASDLKDFQGCFDADLLARAVFGLHRLRLGDKPADVFPRHESQMLWRWWRDGSPAFKFARERFPALESVPDVIRQGVRGICAKLSPREVDYLAGMVVVTAHPWSVCSPEERHAINLAQEAIFMSRRLRYPASQPGFATALDEALFPPVTDRAKWLDAILYGDGKTIRAACRMQGVNRLSIIHGRVVDAGDKVPSPLRWVRALRAVLNPASGPDLRATFMQAARKIQLDLEQIGKGRPDVYRVAALLGIERKDSAARDRQMRRNFEFFGAPTALFLFAHKGFHATSAEAVAAAAGNAPVPRNVITRALGAGLRKPVADQWLIPAVAGDRVLVCSDGLSNDVTAELITATLLAVAEPREAAASLVQAALNAGGHDNVTVVVVDCDRVVSTAPTGLGIDDSTEVPADDTVHDATEEG